MSHFGANAFLWEILRVQKKICQSWVKNHQFRFICADISSFFTNILNIFSCFQLLVALFLIMTTIFLAKLELPFPAGWPRLDWQCADGLFCIFLV